MPTALRGHAIDLPADLILPTSVIQLILGCALGAMPTALRGHAFALPAELILPPSVIQRILDYALGAMPTAGMRGTMS